MKEKRSKKIKLTYCPFCGKEFKSNIVLSIHIGQYHPHLYAETVLIDYIPGVNTEKKGFAYELWLKDIDNNNLVRKCLNCLKELDVPAPASILDYYEYILGYYEYNCALPYPSIFFCSEQCKNEYQKEFEKKVGAGVGTAPFGLKYQDEYDWNI